MTGKPKKVRPAFIPPPWIVVGGKAFVLNDDRVGWLTSHSLRDHPLAICRLCSPPTVTAPMVAVDNRTARLPLIQIGAAPEAVPATGQRRPWWPWLLAAAAFILNVRWPGTSCTGSATRSATPWPARRPPTTWSSAAIPSGRGRLLLDAAPHPVADPLRTAPLPLRPRAVRRAHDVGPVGRAQHPGAGRHRAAQRCAAPPHHVPVPRLRREPGGGVGRLRRHERGQLLLLPHPDRLRLQRVADRATAFRPGAAGRRPGRRDAVPLRDHSPGHRPGRGGGRHPAPTAVGPDHGE